MDKSVLLDIAAATGLFLFTGVEIGIETTIFEILSKFGVVAVLWFWLREVKAQMKEQLVLFSSETALLREEHKITLKEFGEVHKEHKAILAGQLLAKDDIIKSLQEKLKD